MRILDELKAAFGSVAEARQAALSGKAEDLARVISFLLKEEEWQREFFVEVAGKSVFNKEKFLELLDNRELDKSYTKFSNKIGLSLKGKRRFLRAQDDVVLNFPYKDCVLKGAQGEDGAKSKELFFNEILAAAEIDALFRPKALCNFELVSAEGERSVNLLDELKSSSVNLLIKGNNLLALHTLKRRPDICGKVKLIYIDPPYNTGSDSFNYNDRFAHSTWLAFMKNRLEIAREFLRDDGVIFIQCDDSEQAYLKVLCDEIFGRDNFVSCLIWQKKKGGGQDSMYFAKEHEYILCYKKRDWQIIEHAESQDEKDFGKTINGRKAKILKLEKWGTHSLRTDRPTLYYPIKDPSGNDFYPVAPNGAEGGWRKKPESLDAEHIFWQENSKGRLTPYEVIYFDEVREKPRIVKTRTIFDEYGTTTDATKEILGLFENQKLFATPKPEALLKRIIEISTSEGDLVMDFFAGSGTTLAVAHKMRRRWVGVEQMGYIEAVTKERLKKVVAGEQGGVSKAAGWQGGGCFVYAELAPLNATFKEKIAAASEDELAGIYREMEKCAFLDYRVDFCEMLQDADFASLPLEEKKQALFDALDGNMDYVLLSDLEDEGFGLDEETRECNRAFFM